MKFKNKLLKKLTIILSFTLILSISYYVFFYGKVYNSSNIKENISIGSNIEDINPESTVNYLTSLGNRDAGFKQNAESAQFVRNYFKSLGLEPFNNNTYYQRFKANYLNDTRFKIIPVNGEVDNVIGKIKGKDSSKAVIISAHLDSLGSKGVIDNASGVSALLETSKNISQKLKNELFPIDILFVAFNAEEIGFLGSEYFYKEIQKEYKDFYNINIDCVGVKNKPLAIKNEHEKSENLYKDFIKYIDKYNIPTKDILYASDGSEVIGTSDHIQFQEGNKAAIILGEDALADIVHTERDNNISLLDYSEILNLSNAITNFIIDSNGKVY